MGTFERGVWLDLGIPAKKAGILNLGGYSDKSWLYFWLDIFGYYRNNFGVESTFRL